MGLVFLLLMWMGPSVLPPEIPILGGGLSGPVRALLVTIGVQILWHSVRFTDLDKMQAKLMKVFSQLRAKCSFLQSLDFHSLGVVKGIWDDLSHLTTWDRFVQELNLWISSRFPEVKPLLELLRELETAIYHDLKQDFSRGDGS